MGFIATVILLCMLSFCSRSLYICIHIFLFISHFHNALLAKSCLNKSWRWALASRSHFNSLGEIFSVFVSFFRYSPPLSLSLPLSPRVQLIFRSRCMILLARGENSLNFVVCIKDLMSNMNMCDCRRDSSEWYSV